MVLSLYRALKRQLAELRRQPDQFMKACTLYLYEKSAMKLLLKLSIKLL